MVQRNVPFPMIAAWLGNFVQMIEKVYGHHSPGWLKQAAEALSGPPGLGNKNAGSVKINKLMVLLEGIELSTSPLPRECSTTELQQRRLARWKRL